MFLSKFYYLLTDRDSHCFDENITTTHILMLVFPSTFFVDVTHSACLYETYFL